MLGRMLRTWALRLSLKAAYAAGRAAAGGASGGGVRQRVRAPSTHPAPARVLRVAIPTSQWQHSIGVGELVGETGHAVQQAVAEAVASGRRWVALPPRGCFLTGSLECTNVQDGQRVRAEGPWAVPAAPIPARALTALCRA